MAASPASAHPLSKQAETAYARQEYRRAADLFQAASSDFAARGDALMAAEMANNSSVALLRAGDANAAYQAAIGTEIVFAQANDPRRQAIALSNQASALEALHKENQAQALYAQSADLFKQAGDLETRVYVLKSLSYLQFHQRQWFEAMATMKIALDAQKRLTLRERVLKFLLSIVFQLTKG